MMFDQLFEALSPRLEALIKDAMPGLEGKIADYVAALHRIEKRLENIESELDIIHGRLSQLDLPN